MLSFLILMLVGFFVGIVGVIFGIGGGILMIPALVIIFKFPVQQAAATSLIAIIANSLIGSSKNIPAGFANIRIGMFLEIASITGAVAGGFIGVTAGQGVLKILFGLLLIFTSYMMWHKSRVKDSDVIIEGVESAFSGQYYDESVGMMIHYTPVRLGRTFGISAFAGFISGLLGVGGGILKVPAMHIASKMPMKAAAGTSTFMLGITAGAGALIYYKSGFVRSEVVGLMVLGVFVGSRVASRFFGKVEDNKIRFAFIALQGVIGVYMIGREFL